MKKYIITHKFQQSKIRYGNLDEAKCPWPTSKALYLPGFSHCIKLVTEAYFFFSSLILFSVICGIFVSLFHIFLLSATSGMVEMEVIWTICDTVDYISVVFIHLQVKT